MSYRDEIVENLQQGLLKYDATLRIVRSHYDAAHFGFSWVVVEGNGFLLRFLCDRGQFLADIAAEHTPGKWWQVYHVATLLDVNPPDADCGIQALVEFVRLHLKDLARMFGPECRQSVRRLTAMEEERKRKFLASLSK